MKLPYYHVDAFTDKLFRGNPAGICILPSGWLPEQVMQKISSENNLSETAFIVEDGEDFGLRWFTPAVEVDLCGHATIAAAHVLFNEIGHKQNPIKFKTKSGIVSVERREKTLVLDFPSRPPVKCSTPLGPARILGKKPAEVWKSRDYLFVFNEEEDIQNMTPDFDSMKNWECLGVIVTAPGKTADFVSRFFAPRAGVNEDPVTGSAHSTLIPYWAKRLQKSSLKALQLSDRGGELFCQEAGQRVKIGGKAITFCKGEIDLQI
jgi:predicted PhzF superfamily epimerase YddE/YHI9